MADENVDPNVPSTGADKPEEKVDVAELQRQLEHERSLREEEAKQKEFWYNQANSKPAEKPAEKKEAVPDVDDLSKVDLVDLVSGNNVDGMSKFVQAQVKAALKAAGVTTKADVEQLVSGKLSEAQSVSSGMTELVNQHPDLADSNSDLYKEAERQLDLIGKDKAYSGLSDFGKVKLATQLAAAKVGSGNGSAQSQERSRVARIGAQQVTASNRTNNRREEPGELSDEEMAAAKMFGVTPDDFKKNKKELKMFR